MHILKDKTLIILALITSLVLGILTLREYYKKSDTLRSGVLVSIVITKTNCSRVRGSKIEFTYKGKTYYSSVKRNSCYNLAAGDSLNLLHIQGTDYFAELNGSSTGELIGSLISFFFSFLIVIYSLVKIKKAKASNSN
ncbi:hypothetical protein BH10BAC1_BH10BAC1_10420 [soil metagenome]